MHKICSPRGQPRRTKGQNPTCVCLSFTKTPCFFPKQSLLYGVLAVVVRGWCEITHCRQQVRRSVLYVFYEDFGHLGLKMTNTPTVLPPAAGFPSHLLRKSKVFQGFSCLIASSAQSSCLGSRAGVILKIQQNTTKTTKQQKKNTKK